ncbi:beta-ketoacyl synthase [Clostridium sp. CAG:715]|nr:beta-ketoacyl synthase [Clostridium sp. CAG:715]
MNGIFITDASAVFADKLTLDDTIIKGGKFYFGKLEKDFEPIDDERYDLRCNRVLKYLVDKLDLSGFEKDEIGIVIGTTNSGIQEFEDSENKHHAELGNPAEFLKWYLGTKNYAASVSTACTSGAKAFSTAVKLLQNDVCKVVIAGGIDTLAAMPSYGFHALEVLSHEKSNPFSKNRDGISLGEGGALFVLTKDVKMQKCLDVKSITNVGRICKSDNEIVALLGIGETSDAYHSATPDPDGVQAVRAIQLALDDAGLKAEDIDYINLHGTGTVSNDLMEANAIYKVFGDNVPASSTKPFTGHCLGAAASIEAFICYQILKGKRNLPIHKYDNEYDENLPKINLVNSNTENKKINTCMSTSFGFGGTNAVVIIGNKTEAGIAKSDERRSNLIQPANNEIATATLSVSPRNNTNNYLSASQCLPHSEPMVLIDKLIDVDMKKQIVKTSVTIHKDKIFFDKDINGVSPLVGIEFMAQTIGCYAFYKAKMSIPKIGFLLGARLYENSLEKFENGKTYIITAREVYGDSELVSFECLIYNEGEDGDESKYIAKATINAFQPKDVEKYIGELE